VKRLHCRRYLKIIPTHTISVFAAGELASRDTRPSRSGEAWKRNCSLKDVDGGRYSGRANIKNKCEEVKTSKTSASAVIGHRDYELRHDSMLISTGDNSL